MRRGGMGAMLFVTIVSACGDDSASPASADAGASSSSSSSSGAPTSTSHDGVLARGGLPDEATSEQRIAVDATHYYFAAKRGDVEGVVRVRLDGQGGEELTPIDGGVLALFRVGPFLYVVGDGISQLRVDAFATVTKVLPKVWGADSALPAGDFLYVLSRENNKPELRRFSKTGELEPGVITELEDRGLKYFIVAGETVYWTERAAREAPHEIFLVGPDRSVVKTGIQVPARTQTSRQLVVGTYFFYVTSSTLSRIDLTKPSAPAEPLGIPPYGLSGTSYFVANDRLYLVERASDGRDELVRSTGAKPLEKEHVAWLPKDAQAFYPRPEGLFVTTKDFNTDRERSITVFKLPPI